MIEQLLAELVKNSPVIGSTLLILWLSLPQLAERFEPIAKLFRRFSKRWRNRAKAEEQQAEDTRRQEAAEAEAARQKILADAQAVAQTTATTATTAALLIVQRQCNACIDELHGMRDITGRLIDVVEEILPMVPVEHRANARAAIRMARNAM